jgi:hypothetical protein
MIDSLLSQEESLAGHGSLRAGGANGTARTVCCFARRAPGSTCWQCWQMQIGLPWRVHQGVKVLPSENASFRMPKWQAVRSISMICSSSMAYSVDSAARNDWRTRSPQVIVKVCCSRCLSLIRAASMAGRSLRVRNSLLPEVPWSHSC